ncbi:unnamed protein product [Lactuca saligna]|uniref:FAD-binding PCMH-type domain-containing protein n=1 Tax=Lactuca saligna TaxID=75948 RepID=A0AA35VG08_LACSI|nr:unnamed protein product [Lactuca saligna]
MKKSFVFLLVLTLALSFSSAYSQDFISCIESDSANASSISQLIYTPGNASFQPIWQFAVQNTRFLKPSTPRPSIIVTPTDESLVQTSLLCAKKHGYEIRIRSGGHDFEGLSYTADVPFVMIDLNNMRSIDIDVANSTAWVGTGAVLGELYYSIAQKSNNTLYFPGGTWPTVGISGLIGGGGTGNLLRKYATAGDNVLDARIIDVNGKILDRKSMGEDLFWAIRGGVASSFGVVVAWQLQLVPVPEKVTVFIVNRTLEQGATELFYKYQSLATFEDRNLYIRSQAASEFIGNTTQKTMRIIFQGIYQGTTNELIPVMDKVFPELGVTREICQEMTSVQSTLVFFGRPSTTPLEILTNRSAIPKSNSKTKSNFVRTPIPISGLEKIWSKFFENDLSGGLLIIPSGGRMDDYAETATPYPHRAGTLYLLATSVSFVGQANDTTPVSLRRLAWLQSLEELLTPYVSQNPRESYVNNNDLDIGVGAANYMEASVWGERYWKRDNFRRLIRIKANVDPDNFFKFPQSIPVFKRRGLAQ